MKTKISKAEKVNIITLGCSKNLVDSESLMRQIEACNISVVHNASGTEAGTVIINTCGFINDARQESVDTILQYARARKEGLIDRLYITGCLSKRYKTVLEAEIPEADAFFGTDQPEEILRGLGLDYKKELAGERKLSTPSHYAYLKISEGCDRTCAFCAIPQIRGRHISKPVESILKEAAYLAKMGVRELILIAQDLTYYGIDIYRKQMLPELITRLSDTDQFSWIRLHYTYPAGFPKKIIQIMKERDNICNYLDIPVQHASNKVLRLMQRNHNREQVLELIDYFRTEIPGITLRTTVLTGHPGERQAEFNELLEFIREVKFERLGAFTYSHEENTPAALNYRDTVPEKEKTRRMEQIMEVQQSISREINELKKSKIFKVIIDNTEGDYYLGRTDADSPEVDNEVLIEKKKAILSPGQFYNVRITGCDDYDLYGNVVE